MNYNQKDLILTQIRQDIINNIDKNSSVSHDKFFKEDESAKTYGLKTAEVHKIAKTVFEQVKDFSKQAIFELCEELWESGYMEEVFVACNWSEILHKKYEQTDFYTFERWLGNYVTNWAHCDTLCNHTIGSFVMTYPDYINNLKRWAKSPNRWLR